MRVPISWLREYVDLPAHVTGRDLAAKLIQLGLEVETVDVVGDVQGPLVLGRVAEITELTDFKKPIRYCQVDVGSVSGENQSIVCGATNFAVGDLVVVVLPGAVLPGGFEIAARKTYGHVSEGMICSARELGLGDEHVGIMVLPAGSGQPGDAAGPILGLGEEVLDIAVTPDRGYALSIRGVAREAAIAYGLAFTDKALELAPLEVPRASSVPWSCSSDDLTACDVFTVRTLTDVDPAAASPLWMQSRLRAAGMRPISIVVDVTNYVMLETGQPLHAFDVDKLTGDLVARRAADGEKLETLDHVLRTLDPADIVIADESGPLALAGTMGGRATEITDTSTTIALEAAHFNPIAVAKMSRRHRLSTEASRRFERGVDRVIAPYASGRAASLLVELAGATNVGMVAVEAPHEPEAIDLDSQLPARVAGMVISDESVIANLTAVGCDVLLSAGRLTVFAPTWRPDLTDPADLVEEVIRLIGYDAVPSRLPQAPAGRGLTPQQQVRRRISRVAAGLGLLEVLNYPFVGEADLAKTGIDSADPRSHVVNLVNPLSDEQPSMRPYLLPGLLAATRRNVSRGANSVAVYEIGAVFVPSPTPPRLAIRPSVTARPSEVELAALNDGLPRQSRHLAAVLAGEREADGWWGKGRVADWSDAVSIARRIVSATGLPPTVSAAQLMPFHPGRCAQISVGDVSLGHAGELHPRVTSAWDLPPRTVALELDIDALVGLARDVVPAGPTFGTMPVAKEDVALVVAADVPAVDVEAALRIGAGDLLESVRLFDVYQGEQIGVGMKSLAFSLRFRAPDRTLEVAEVSAARDRAVANANALTGATLRA